MFGTMNDLLRDERLECRRKFTYGLWPQGREDMYIIASLDIS